MHEYLKSITPERVFKWSIVFFVVALEILVILTIILTLFGVIG